MLVVPLLSVAAVGVVVLVAEVARPPGTTSLFGVELGMRMDEVMGAFEPRERGTWSLGATSTRAEPDGGDDTGISWTARAAPSDVTPIRARFEFHESRLAAVRATFSRSVTVAQIEQRVGLPEVHERGGAHTWDLPGSFCIVMEEADGNRSLFLLDATSPRYEGEIELLRRVDQLP